MKYKAALFDMDGTVLDTLGDLSDSLNHTLKAHGMPEHTIDEARMMLGDGMNVLIHRAAPAGTPEEKIQEVLADYKAYYGSHSSIKTKVFDGIPELLEELRRRGVKTGVVSNKGDFAVQDLSKTYFEGLMDASAGENEAAGIARKPAPDMCLNMLKLFGVTPSEAVYIGDTEVDIETAKNCGMDCIICSWGFRSVEHLKEKGAEVIVDTPMEILKAMENAK